MQRYSKSSPVSCHSELVPNRMWISRVNVSTRTPASADNEIWDSTHIKSLVIMGMACEICANIVGMIQGALLAGQKIPALLMKLSIMPQPAPERWLQFSPCQHSHSILPNPLGKRSVCRRMRRGSPRSR